MFHSHFFLLGPGIKNLDSQNGNIMDGLRDKTAILWMD